MAYDLTDSTGQHRPGPSIGGWTDIEHYLLQKKISSAVYPQLASIFNHGYANSPTRLKYECEALAKHCTQADVKKTLAHIAKVASKSKDIVILHSGNIK